jgi:hypothetical protein
LKLPLDWIEYFELAIRADEIVTACPFSPTIYTEISPGWRDQMAKRRRTNKRQPPEGARSASEQDQPVLHNNVPAYVLSSIGTNLRFSGPT